VADGAFIPVGRVVKAHGLDGELSVKLEPGLDDLPIGLEVWFVPPPAGIRSGRITAVRSGPKGPLVSVSGVADIDSASALRGLTLVADGASIPAGILDPRPASVIGFSVRDTQRGDLGVLTDVIETGANDVWVVAEGPFGQVLIPVIDEVVVEVDEHARTCLVELLPGLIEE
jgi:16S rRNA processing protein RimM